MKINWKLLHADLDKYRANFSFRDLASEWELPPSTFTRIKHGQGISAEALGQILVGMDVRVERYQVVSKSKRVVG